MSYLDRSVLKRPIGSFSKWSGHFVAHFNPMDPERLILQWHSHIAIPEWKSDLSIRLCFHCNGRMGLSKHHCRLCGELFCSFCVSKYWLYKHFEKRVKNSKDSKTILASVCFGCRDKCLRRREDMLSSHSKEYRPRKQRIQLQCIDSGVHISPPLSWASLHEYRDCFICHAKTKAKRKNCRICGELFCRKCLSRLLHLPRVFENKSKLRKSKVCKECRFLMVGRIVMFHEMPFDESSYDCTRHVSVYDSAVNGMSQIEWSKSYPLQDSSHSVESLCGEEECSAEVVSLSISTQYAAGEVIDVHRKIIQSAETLALVEALYDFISASEHELSFSRGDILKVIKYGTNWWLAIHRLERIGWIPPNHVRRL